ncbi:hypothetical protein ACUIJP_04505 [Leuconostoc pseudomesenteroides]|uniref:hypothetical protein n=1 Tax=Leuconostoc pseudomesenteroides TaxID=33968 RepID=UPI00403DE483
MTKPEMTYSTSQSDSMQSKGMFVYKGSESTGYVDLLSYVSKADFNETKSDLETRLTKLEIWRNVTVGIMISVIAPIIVGVVIAFISSHFNWK